MNDKCLFSLYLDLDGVLVDFEGGFFRLTNGISIERYKEMFGEDTFYKRYNGEKREFWENMDWLHGGKELWDIASKLFKNVYVLSSTGNVVPTIAKKIHDGKLIWLNKNIPSLPKDHVIIVNGRHLKQKYATKLSILVDDKSDTINQWNAAGGYGILHVGNNYKKTIDDLEDLAAPLKLGNIAKKLK